VAAVGRKSGRNAVIYMDPTGSAAASRLAYQAKWSINFTVDKFDVTSVDDSNKTYVAGFPDAQGQFSGFYDDTSAQTYTAATDGLARKMYLYPDKNLATQYWFGTILPDFSIDGDVGAAITEGTSWAAASPIIKVG
jgi:hypothetical protein